MAKEVIGVDRYNGDLYAYDQANDTFYRAKNTGLGDLGAINWEAIFSGINNNPLVQGLGQRISGANNQFFLQQNRYGAYGANVTTSGPGFFGTINPMYLLLGGGLALFLLMKR